MVPDSKPGRDRDFPPVQTGPGTHPGSCKMGTGSFLGIKCGRSVLLTTHPLLVPRSRKSRAIPLPPLWATPGLQRDHFFTKILNNSINYNGGGGVDRLEQHILVLHFLSELLNIVPLAFSIGTLNQAASSI
jgi:hypothetical protein